MSPDRVLYNLAAAAMMKEAGFPEGYPFASKGMHAQGPTVSADPGGRNLAPPGNTFGRPNTWVFKDDTKTPAAESAPAAKPTTQTPQSTNTNPRKPVDTGNKSVSTLQRTWGAGGVLNRLFGR